MLYTCRVCGKEYRYLKSRDKHEEREHPGIVCDKPSVSDMIEETVPCKSSDDRYSYAVQRLSMGIFIRNFDDAVREADGNRILQCWKFALLLFKANGHHKYSLAALQLIAQTIATLTPREAHSLIWNRTVNNGHGNISLDLRLEQINKITKDMLKNLGPNITENTALRCSRAVYHVEQLIQSVDDDLHLSNPHGKHKVHKSEAGFRSLVHALHQRGKVFHYSESTDRQYIEFRNFPSNCALKNLNMKLLNHWICSHKKELNKKELLQ